MKKNRMMRLASVLLVCVLLTTSVISGTFAKYTTAVASEDTARVARWGFEATTMDITDLFDVIYTHDVNGNTVISSVEGEDVIAPGTEGDATFAFYYDSDNGEAPEVAYQFTVSVDGSECDPTIANNGSIQWKLDNGDWGDWGTLLENIKALSGNASGSKRYEANDIPEAFATKDDSHTIAWQWIFENNNDVTDTTLGNADPLADVTLKITVSATQID